MNIHSRARSCPFSRALFVQRVLSGMSVIQASELAEFSERTGHKWLKRFRLEGNRASRTASASPVAWREAMDLALSSRP
ncbi:leucine zipper domain-containing protein [Geothrix paludis]|uniref:leucine zipper domain-containing protein n=1 Tax=Geothrix paludis TaxID=2922722 RepID=UPI003C2BCB36